MWISGKRAFRKREHKFKELKAKACLVFYVPGPELSALNVFLLRFKTEFIEIVWLIR